MADLTMLKIRLKLVNLLIFNQLSFIIISKMLLKQQKALCLSQKAFKFYSLCTFFASL